MRRDRRGSHALRLRGPSRRGPEVSLCGPLQHDHEQEGESVEDGAVDFKSTPLEPLALRARVVQFQKPTNVYLYFPIRGQKRTFPFMMVGLSRRVILAGTERLHGLVRDVGPERSVHAARYPGPTVLSTGERT
jgi:hypothetical protein